MVSLSFSDQQPAALYHAIASNSSSPRENIRNLLTTEWLKFSLPSFSCRRNILIFSLLILLCRLSGWFIKKLTEKSEDSLFSFLQTTKNQTTNSPIYKIKQKKIISLPVENQCKRKTWAFFHRISITWTESCLSTFNICTNEHHTELPFLYVFSSSCTTCLKII